MNEDQQETSANRSPTKKKWILASLIVVVAVTLAVGIPFYLHHRATHVTTDDAFVDGYIHYVTPRILGKIVAIAVDDNQTVNAGDIVVNLDDRDLETEITLAQHRLALAQNRVAAALESAAAAREQIAGLKAQARFAAVQKQRATVLTRSNAVPQIQFDEATMRWRSLSDQVAATERQRREILASLGPAGPGGELTDVSLAKTALAQAQLQLEYATIRSPVRGIVTRKQVQAGQVVSPGQPLFSVVPLDNLFITANYKETDLTNVRVGQHVTVDVDTYPDIHLRGHVDSIMSGTGAAFSLIPPENATGNFVKVVQRIPVKIVLDGPPVAPVLRVGMSVEPTILVDQP